MSLSNAILPNGDPAGLPSPVPCDDLFALHEVAFGLPCEDPWLRQRSGPARAYLDAAEEAWRNQEEWMDFLDQESPCWDLKRAERDLYLHVLDPYTEHVQTVLDVGCGIGRLTHPFLDRGATVTGVDGDLKSLQRCAWHAAGREGALELHWSTVGALPAIQVDLAIAAEVLCYVEDPDAALRALVSRVKPGGLVFVTMEARWGWALAQDAPVDGLDALLGDEPVLNLPGDRYVQLFDEDRMRRWLTDAGLQIETLVPTHYLTDGPLESMVPDPLSLEMLIEAEARCRNHPVFRPLNRIWTAVARVPAP